MTDFVRLEQDVIDEIVRVCDVMLDEFTSIRESVDRLSDTRGFGDLESAQQLAAGYRRKAAGTPESARERVEQYIDALTRIRDAFASGGEAFLEAEFEWARQLSRISVD